MNVLNFCFINLCNLLILEIITCLIEFVIVIKFLIIHRYISNIQSELLTVN